jgi:hypothetical protein
MSEHTPSPWFFGNTSQHEALILGGHGKRYVCHVTVEQAGGGMIAQSMEAERKANARLIVASPDMHQALRVFIRAFELEHPGVENKDEDWIYDECRSVGLAYIQARAALAKASDPA